MLCATFESKDLNKISKKASNYLGPQMVEKETVEIKIRDIMTEIGWMQWNKNKLLQELRDTKQRYEEEKKREREDL